MRKRKARGERAPPGSIRRKRQSVAAMAAVREASAEINANAHTKSTVQLHANGFIHSRMTRARLMHTLICRLVGECCAGCVTSRTVSWLTLLSVFDASPAKQCRLSLGVVLSQCLTKLQVCWLVADQAVVAPCEGLCVG